MWVWFGCVTSKRVWRRLRWWTYVNVTERWWESNPAHTHKHTHNEMIRDGGVLFMLIWSASRMLWRRIIPTFLMSFHKQWGWNQTPPRNRNHSLLIYRRVGVAQLQGSNLTTRPTVTKRPLDGPAKREMWFISNFCSSCSSSSDLLHVHESRLWATRILITRDAVESFIITFYFIHERVSQLLLKV